MAVPLLFSLNPEAPVIPLALMAAGAWRINYE